MIPAITNVRGTLGVALAIGKLTEMGYAVAVPLNPALRYDLLVEQAGKCLRVQVKTGSKVNGVLVCKLASQQRRVEDGVHVCGSLGYTVQDTDVILCCWPEGHRWFWIPPSVFEGQQQIWLRIDKPRFAHPGIRWASEFEV